MVWPNWFKRLLSRLYLKPTLLNLINLQRVLLAINEIEHMIKTHHFFVQYPQTAKTESNVSL